MPDPEQGEQPDRQERDRFECPTVGEKGSSRTLTSLGVPDPDQRAIDFVGIMNGLLDDRLVGNGVRGARVDAAAVLTAWLIGWAPGSDTRGRHVGIDGGAR